MRLCSYYFDAGNDEKVMKKCNAIHYAWIAGGTGEAGGTGGRFAASRAYAALREAPLPAAFRLQCRMGGVHAREFRYVHIRDF
jgi:hypothetical protein